MPQFVTNGEEETAAIGERLGRLLGVGAVVLLYGDLGAGKTAFVRGLARGVEASSDDVSSPTFALIQQYRGRLTLHHVDLYRLDPREVDDLGLDELIDGNGVVAVEWAERWRNRPDSAFEVRLDDMGHEQRRIHVSVPLL